MSGSVHRRADAVDRLRRLEEDVRRLETRKAPEGPGSRSYLVDTLDLTPYLSAGPDGFWEIQEGRTPMLTRVLVPDSDTVSGWTPSAHVFGEGVVLFKRRTDWSDPTTVPTAVEVVNGLPAEWQPATFNTDWFPLVAVPDLSFVQAGGEPPPNNDYRRVWAGYMTEIGELEIDDVDQRVGFWDRFGLWGPERGGEFSVTEPPGMPQALNTGPDAVGTGTLRAGRLDVVRASNVRGYMTTVDGRYVLFHDPPPTYKDGTLAPISVEIRFPSDAPVDMAAGVFMRADADNDRILHVEWRKINATTVRLQLVLTQELTRTVVAVGVEDVDLVATGLGAGGTMRLSAWSRLNPDGSCFCQFSGTFNGTRTATIAAAQAPQVEEPSGPFIDAVQGYTDFVPQIVGYQASLTLDDRTNGWVPEGTALSLDHLHYCTASTTF